MAASREIVGERKRERDGEKETERDRERERGRGLEAGRGREHVEKLREYMLRCFRKYMVCRK